VLARAVPWAVGLLLAAGGAGRAHDFWIEPSTFRPAPHERVALRLRVGERLRGEPVPLLPGRVRAFVVATGDGVRPIAGRAGAEPAGAVQIARTGIAVVGYRSLPQRIELAASDFARYLAEEGLEEVARARAARGEAAAPGRERFSRAAKALLAVGDPRPAAGHDRVLGFTLELVPERSPWALRPGDALPVVLRHEGRPLAGALVAALSATAGRVAAARTDAAGRVHLPLDRAGAWLVKAVHMTALPAGGDADWESVWASLTFEVVE
jgi:hypothetical protein